MVIGHTAYGAVKAAIEQIDANDALPGSIDGLVDVIRPAVMAAAGQSGDKLENTIRANVRKCAETIRCLDPILSKAVSSQGPKVGGAIYDLKSGMVLVLS